MHTQAQIQQYRETSSGTYMMIHVPDKVGYFFKDKSCKDAELRLNDGRSISALQRRKAYATIRDIADYTGYAPEEQKEWLKYLYIERTGGGYISLSGCSMDEAREFINVIMEYAIENGICLSAAGVERTDDIGKYLYFCIKHRKCAICGKDGEIHHVDAIGMGNDRHQVDDSSYRKICLCRLHHRIAHQKGMSDFEKMYHVYGIVVREVKEDGCTNTGKNIV